MAIPVLATDGYKLSMAQAGWPLRRETFHYAHRRGGPHYLPFDVAEMIGGLLPAAPTEEERAYLRSQGYEMGGAFWAALADTEALEIDALPAGSWFFDREPVFSITGPSALVSWLEPMVLQLHARIQVATTALLEPERLPEVVGQPTCSAHIGLIEETLQQVGVDAPPMQNGLAAYMDEVTARVQRLVEIVEDPTRIFEVGMRAASCMAQHHLALMACAEAGVVATSNAHLARQNRMRTVGTMGHEHVQRYGSDRAAFQAMRDRFPGPSSFLLDTYDTVRSGLPTAFSMVAREPERRDTVRFDSGDKHAQYTIALDLARRMGISPRFILEDGFNAEMTEAFEARRRQEGIPATDQLYGYGGHIVRSSADPLTRDRVAAVFKLSQTGDTPTMKFGDEPGSGKESIPGRPRVCRRISSHPTRPAGVVIQQGEAVPEGFVVLTGAERPPPEARLSPAQARALAGHRRPLYSPATEALVSHLTSERARHIDALQGGH